MQRRESIGFTLIELLIVVLIIAILAAIAVPNFLEFQVRAKVSRVKSDMRSLATALEAYAVDNSDYPVAANRLGFNWHPFSSRLYPLTTPISYISTIPKDPFILALNNTDRNIYDTFDYYSVSSEIVRFPNADPNRNNSLFGRKWRLASRGPDGLKDFTGRVLYDPTNGTTSNGDIIMVQGDGFNVPTGHVLYNNP